MEGSGREGVNGRGRRRRLEMGTGMVTGMEREWNGNGSRKGIGSGKVTEMSYQTFYCAFYPLVCPKKYIPCKHYDDVQKLSKWAYC